MDTPICDFVRQYAQKNAMRLHMPGHKGTSVLGFEALDITEIDGADSLYEAQGIIRRSEENAGALFGAHSFYSTEGSSLAIRAMLYLMVLYARQQGKRPLIAAARNVHKTFLTAAALLDFDVQWLYGTGDSYLSCQITAEQLEAEFSSKLPCAVYLTCPDYLGNMMDVQRIAEVCHRHGVLLLVDNAHGAYLKFLPVSLHPMDLGADLCCDSAHKTLPVLTGGAYLHISPAAPRMFAEHAKKALSMFGSTSPSYLILQSLDAANHTLAGGFREKLAAYTGALESTKAELIRHGYHFTGCEPLKLTINAKKYGYTGQELARILQDRNIVCEFADPDYLVLMFTPDNRINSIALLKEILISIPKKKAIREAPPMIHKSVTAMPIREATLSPSESVPIQNAEGRILATPSVSCPPAVPIVVCGEIISKTAIEAFQYYGIKNCDIVI